MARLEEVQLISPELAPAFRTIIAEELHFERAEILRGVEQLLLEHNHRWSPVNGHMPVGDHEPTGISEANYVVHPTEPQSALVPIKTIEAYPVAPMKNNDETLAVCNGIGASEVLTASSTAESCMLPQAQVTKVKELDKAVTPDPKIKHKSTVHELEAALDRFAHELPDVSSGWGWPHIPYRKTWKQDTFLERTVNNPMFEGVSSMIIALNVFVQALDMQYDGMELGYVLGVPKFNESANDIWPGATIFLLVAETIFSAWFVLELLMRIGAAKERAVWSYWIWLDIVVVTASFIEYAGETGTFNPRMFRMLRFLRMLKMFRLAKNIGMLQALMFFIKAIKESMGALMWTFVVLLCIQIVVGMAIHQVLSVWFNHHKNDDSMKPEVLRVFAYFGTFTKTMITMFEITIANWVVTCRLLMNDVSEWFGLFYVIYRCMFCFGAVKVITAVFIAQTNRSVARDDDLVVMMQEQERKEFRKKMQEMFNGLDTSRDGYLTWSEFEQITGNELWRSWGDKLGLPMCDLVNLFELLAGDDGRVSAKEFFDGIQRCKGTAKSVDVVWLLSEVNRLVKGNEERNSREQSLLGETVNKPEDSCIPEAPGDNQTANPGSVVCVDSYRYEKKSM